MRYLKIITGTLFIILLVVFILRNDDLHRPVHLTFGLSIFTQGMSLTENQIFDDQPASTEETGITTSMETAAPKARITSEGVDVPVFVLVFMAFFLGLVVASLLSLSEKFRLKRVVRVGNGRIRDLEAEIKSLRNMPINQPNESISLPGQEQASTEEGEHKED